MSAFDSSGGANPADMTRDDVQDRLGPADGYNTESSRSNSPNDQA